ncbi:hypothetical protein [Vitiosangium sp. GDMCC 1.1324]|uniref:hypothetical protein n=1 Tax=Vitiosangium sp. (strain GDMCC 1.1324) TaxID=2138576 RepID=UPI00130E4710|nr:hypothetical protein [Vitiosangium sp. GDMCC 1.1324]
MIREPKDVLADIGAVIRTGGRGPLSALVVELIASLCMHQQFPEDAFERLLSLLSDPVLRAHEGAWGLLKEIDGSWALLTAPQREKLRPLLVESFDQWGSPMGAFVIGEVLGERYCDEDALKALSTLSKGASMPARALVPHGLESLALHTKSAEIRRRAVEMLRELKRDRVAQVRDEACTALRKLGEESM